MGCCVSIRVICIRAHYLSELPQTPCELATLVLSRFRPRGVYSIALIALPPPRLFLCLQALTKTEPISEKEWLDVTYTDEMKAKHYEKQAQIAKMEAAEKNK